mmetsp:Transcript_18799/g.55130  ORF Transcript_18799/g.55130 Transcript_18799/m.55130 type:complete len:202 (+) Transcript_18799:28-633(+)
MRATGILSLDWTSSRTVTMAELACRLLADLQGAPWKTSSCWRVDHVAHVFCEKLRRKAPLPLPPVLAVVLSAREHLHGRGHEGRAAPLRIEAGVSIFSAQLQVHVTISELAGDVHPVFAADEGKRSRRLLAVQTNAIRPLLCASVERRDHKDGGVRRTGLMGDTSSLEGKGLAATRRCGCDHVESYFAFRARMSACPGRGS